MIGAVRLGDDELTGDELERLTLEHAEVDQSVVLHSGPVPERQRRLLHGFNLARSVESINVERQRHCVKMRSDEALNRARTSIRARYHSPARAPAWLPMFSNAERRSPWVPSCDSLLCSCSA